MIGRSALAKWLAAHKSLAATATSGTVVAALITTVAVVSGGYQAQRMDLGDAAVWVTSQSRQLLGRANTEIQQLNTAIPSSGRDVDVVQSGQNVIMVDHGNDTAAVVDTATSTTGTSVPLPPRDPSIQITGGRVAIESGGTGQVWLTSMSQFADFDASQTATIDLGGRSVTTMDAAGTFFAYLSETHQIHRVDTANSDTVQTTVSVPASSDPAAETLTTVDSQWALLDPGAKKLYLPRGTVDLSSALAGATDPVLQQPSTTGDTVYLSSSSGLIGVPLGGSSGAVRLAKGDLGKPAAPASVNGCVYAAWANGESWRTCGKATDGREAQLPGMPSNAELAFRVNGTDIVLNNTLDGQSWALQHGNALIDNWDALIVKKDNTQRIDQNKEDTPPQYEKAQLPPIAVDDQFGARPGRVSTLPVLLNDSDPNGDVILIASTTAIPTAQGTLDLVNNDQQVQITLPATASGSLAFDYTITDGRGGTASAHVTVTVRTPDQNSPPVQVHETKATVQTGGRVTTQVLGDWYDPDGDPFYLAAATVPAPNGVSFSPQGSVVYTDKGAGGNLENVSLVVSDSRAQGTGTLAVTVRPAGSVPIFTEPFGQQTPAGREITVTPLAHVRGGTGTLRLSNVPAKTDATITPDYQGGTFRFSSDHVGVHYLEYTVTDGVLTATGTVRIDVQAPLDGKTQPIPVPHTAFIHEQSTAEVDVLATDIDPGGGVLLITGVSNVPPASGVRVEILQQRILRVTLTKPLGGPVAFNYQISNGLAQAQGTVTVVEIPQPAIRQPPVANPDSVSVRVGDAVDIPVLDNDSQPDGDELTLDPTLANPLPAGAGLLFASGDVLRYLAPKKTGNFTATYRVSAPDGQWATADVQISVREVDAATNNPPVPKTVTARVLAGDTVRIPIPLSGVDPDGDSVQLVGQESNPEKGAVTEVGSDWIDYQAGDYSAGTDTFSYGVVDALGARATGTVRVGIASKLDGARNPVAVEDEVSVRPGRTVSVQVLANDSDPDNSPLTITHVAATSGKAKAVVSGSVVKVTAPQAEGRYGFIYDIQNATGGTSSNFLTVVVSKDAPLARPQVSDTVLDLSDILGKKTVDVNVLANAFFADGPVSGLKLSVQPGYGSVATVTADRRIRVTIGDKSQIIPFAVANPDDAKIVSYAFIWVPGFDDALPQLKRGVKALSVSSESTLTIHLNDYVVAVGGKKVMLTDASTVRATHSNGQSLVQDGDTLVFTSAARYFGPASISFEVTDGSSPGDSQGRTATLVLPITVTPRQNQPPVFDGGLIDFEPGQSKTIDLVKLTSYPYMKDQSELVYSVLDPKPTGFSLSLSGQRLTIRADEKTPKGTNATVLVGVKDAVNAGQAGRIDLSTVPSTKPIAVPRADEAIAPRGKTTTVDVLANDGATNPFPGTPLRVIAVKGLDSASLPKGVSITPSADKSTLSVTVSATAAPVDTNLQYEVADATGDPDRYAWGTVRISVQDRPDPVSNLQLTAIGDRSLGFSWSPGAFNNSPITGFEVTVTRANGQVVGSPVRCASASCTIPTPGNGADNGVQIQVAARNALGLSDPVTYPETVWSDVVPAAPANLAATPLDNGLRVTWTKPDTVSGASTISSYLVSVGGVSVTVPVSGSDPVGTSYSRNITDSSLANGSVVPIQVTSRNDFFGGSPNWNTATASGVPAGAPQVAGAPTAQADTGAGTMAQLGWDGVFSSNGQSISAYYAAVYVGDAQPSCTVTGVSSGQPKLSVDENGAQKVTKITDGSTQTGFSGLSPNVGYHFIVFAYNGQGCTASSVVTATPRTTPAAPSFTVGGPTSSGNDSYDFRLTDAETSGVGDDGSVSYQYQFVGAVSTDPAAVAINGVLNAGSQGYGTSVTVELRALVSYPGGLVLRSDWSAPKALGIPVSTQPDGLHFGTVSIPPQTGAGGDPGGVPTGQFTWTAAPKGAYDSVTFSCDGQQPAAMDGSHLSCTLPAGVVAGTLTVSVTAGGKTYTDTYRSQDVD